MRHPRVTLALKSGVRIKVDRLLPIIGAVKSDLHRPLEDGASIKNCLFGPAGRSACGSKGTEGRMSGKYGTERVDARRIGLVAEEQS